MKNNEKNFGTKPNPFFCASSCFCCLGYVTSWAFSVQFPGGVFGGIRDNSASLFCEVK